MGRTKKILKILFGAPDLFGESIVKWLGLKNGDLIIVIPMFLIGWLLYWQFFMQYASFTWRFIPDFLMGFLTCLIMFKFRKNKKEDNGLPPTSKEVGILPNEL